MVDGENENGDSLSAEASAYFESRGETVEAPKPDPEVAQPEPDAPEPGERPNQGGLDPRGLAAVREEREERKRLKAELDEVKRNHAVLSDRWNTFLTMGTMGQQEQPAPKDEDPEPDPNVDIFEHSKWQARQLAKLRDQMQSKDAAERQAVEAQQHEAKVWQFWEASVGEFAAQQPEFLPATKWLAELRDKQLTALGRVDARFSTKASRDAQIDSELREIIIQAAQQNISPAEIVYGLATDYGYQGKAPAAADPAAAVAALAANVDAETSLSDLGGSAPKAALSAKDIADMSPDDFGKWLAKNGEAGFKKLMGGR